MTPLGLIAFALMAVAWLFAAVMLVANYLRGSPERRFSGPPEGQCCDNGRFDEAHDCQKQPGDAPLTWPGPVLPPSDAALSGLARHEAADWPNWTRRHPEGPDNDQDPEKPWRAE